MVLFVPDELEEVVERGAASPPLALLAAFPRTLVETKFTVPSNTSFG